MTKPPLFFLQIIHLISFLLLISQPFLVISQSPPSELEILLKIKQQWGNQPSLSSWTNTTSLCLWQGIICSGDKTVTGISLNSQNITGEVPPSICELKNLTILDLGNNNIQGTFPTSLYNCTKLQKLDLSQNYFIGGLPNDIGSLSSSLQHLVLTANNFTGDIPTTLAQLKGLITLYLDSNLFNGTFPSELGTLENLEELVLVNNPFSPMHLPKEFGMLKKLKLLWMAQCNLIGEIPKEYANLTSLEHLDLVENDLVGEIPSGLFLIKNLTYVYLFKNRLSGELPVSIEAFNLTEIDFSQNNLTGEIPAGIGELQKLEILALQNNQLYGSLPPSIGLLPNLKILKLFQNRFSGPLPPEIGLHSKLERFEVSDNAFTGLLPENLCSGGTLLGVVASNNQLNGTIPSSLGQCSSLTVVFLSNNSLTGEVPKGLWTLQNMMWLLLGSNQFSGQLPEKLAMNVSIIDISNNKFSGIIPKSIGTWVKLRAFNASKNMITGTIPMELTSLSVLNTLSLHRNQLRGELPSEIISWQSLNSLDLSHNELSGSIPSALGSLPVLTDLDLSYNQFSGQIPSVLGDLEFTSLNLSYNMLQGSIPYSLDNSAYKASFLNTLLCSNSRFLDLPNCSNHRTKPKFHSKYLILIIILTLVALIAAVYLIVFIINEIRQRKNKQELATWKLTSFHRLNFTEEKILANLTENNVIGYGGSGKLYRIPINQSGNIVAVKRIWSNSKTNKDLEKEFMAEVQILGTIRHLNIVKLLCCISDESSKLLVYEYMENQSLDKWIHAGKKRPVSSVNGSVHHVNLDWPARLKIAVDAAQGLKYMHTDCSPPIIHRDVKSSNILLDSEFNAKIADFGLAKIMSKPRGQPNTMSNVAGSFGYMPPEYCYTTKVNEKIDIYSFGVVLLELVTGKEAHIGDEHSNLTDWAWKHYSQGRPIEDVLEKEIKEPCYLEEMTQVFMIGLMCTSTLPSSRPTMKEVVQLLERLSTPKGSEKPNKRSDRDVYPLLGGENYISSCKNSTRIAEDYYNIV